MDLNTLKNPLIKKFFDEIVSKETPNVTLKYKKEDSINKILALVVGIFNKDFYDNYYVTIGDTIYLPDSLENSSRSTSMVLLEIIIHEWIHVMQQKRHTRFLFSVLYLFPQVLSIFSLFALLAIPFSNFWLLCLLCLLFLLPLPAYFRMKYELEAYRVSLIFYKLVYDIQDTSGMERWILNQLTKKWYYFTWPFKKHLENLLKTDVLTINSREYNLIIDFLKRNI